MLWAQPASFTSLQPGGLSLPNLRVFPWTESLSSLMKIVQLFTSLETHAIHLASCWHLLMVELWPEDVFGSFYWVMSEGEPAMSGIKPGASTNKPYGF